MNHCFTRPRCSSAFEEMGEIVGKLLVLLVAGVFLLLMVRVIEC